MPVQQSKKVINVNKLRYVSDYLLNAQFSLEKSLPGVGDIVYTHIIEKISRLIKYYRTYTPADPKSIIDDFNNIFAIATPYLHRYSTMLKKHTDFLSGIKIIYDFIEEITKEPEQIKTPHDIVGRGTGGFIVRRKDASDIIEKVFHVSANNSREDSVKHTGTWWVLLEDGTYQLIRSMRHDPHRNTYNGGRNADYIGEQLQKEYTIQGRYTPKKTSTELPEYFDKTFLKNLTKDIQKIKIEYPNKDNTLLIFFDQSTKQSLSNNNNPPNIVAKNERNNNNNNNIDDPESYSSVDNTEDSDLESESYSGVRALFGTEDSDSESESYSGVRALFGTEDSDSESESYSGVRALFGTEDSDSESDDNHDNNSENNNNIPINTDTNNNKKHINSFSSIPLFTKKSNIKAIKDNLDIDVKEVNLNDCPNNIESVYKFDIANLRLVNNVVNILRALEKSYINKDFSLNSEYCKDFIVNIVSIGAILHPTPLTIAGSLATEFILNNNDLVTPAASLANTIALNIAPMHPIGEFAVAMVKFSVGIQVLNNIHDLITIDSAELYQHIFYPEKNINDNIDIETNFVVGPTGTTYTSDEIDI